MGGVREIILLSKRGAFHFNSASVGLIFIEIVIPFFLILLVFGLGAALMRTKFQRATVGKTIVCFVVIFGALGFIMGITG
jgi:hypothetical protein